jgi:hypothetical protein
MPKTTNPESFGAPLQSAYENYLENCASASHGLEPLMKAWARGHLELMTLMSRRARSYLELPERLGNCRSPQDFATEHIRFWQTLYQDYAEGAQRLALAWSSMVQQTITPSGHRSEEREVTFPEGGEDRAERDRAAGRRAA